MTDNSVVQRRSESFPLSSHYPFNPLHFSILYHLLEILHCLWTRSGTGLPQESQTHICNTSAMAPFLVADPLFPTYELEAHNRTASYSKQSAVKTPRLRSPQSLQNMNSSGGPSIRDTGNRANQWSRRTSHSASLTDLDALVQDYEKLNFLKRCGTDGNTGSELPFPVKVDTLETPTVAEKISALARNHITDWQERKAEKRTNKRQQAWPSEQPYILPTNRRNNSRGCSCGPPGCCIFEKLAKEDREAEATAIAAAEEIVKSRRNSRQIIPIFGKTHYLTCTKSSKRKDKDKGKGKEVDSAKNGCSDIGRCSFREDPSDDEDQSSLSISSRIPWYPEFQTKPPPSCNCLLFKLGHGFSDGEIQKMRWFLDRIGRGLAVPGDWFEEETLCAAQRECRQWNILHPLRSQSLEYLAAFPSNGNFNSNSF